MMQSYRYPGLQPFEKKDAALFYGRERESRDLCAQVTVEKLVVLFAKSGMGKSSLVNAGLAPLLEKTNILLLRIRLSNVAVPPEEQFLQELERDEYEGAVVLDPALRQSGATLWEQIKAARFTKNGAPAVPLFNLDQFEEIFTLYTPVRRERFLRELADLANDTPPETLLERLRARIAAGERLDVPALEASPRCKFLFAIRSDLLHQLNALTPLIPDIMRSRFELLPFGREQAEEAITFPAMLRDPGRSFVSPAFRFDDASLDTLIGYLSKNGTEDIESFQLQILCQNIERLMTGEKPAAGLTLSNKLVTPALFGGEEGLNNILRNFYTDQIAALPTEKQLIAREIVEEQLITESGRRRSVAEDDLLHFHADITLLRQLEETRLLRKEPRLKTFYYEISHDTLVPPILVQYKERQQEEDRLAEIERRRREQEERDAQLAEERRKRMRIFRFMLFALTLAALAIAAMVYAIIQRDRAERDKRRAYANDLAYKSKIALRDGDRSAAFRLAEFAHLYADDDNPNVMYALVEAAYYNDHADTTRRLPWNFSCEGHNKAVTSVALSSDGKRLATGSEDNSVKIRDAANGLELAGFADHNKPVLCIAFSPDGKKIASGSDDNTVKIRDLESGKVLSLTGHTESVRSVAFSPDGSKIATGSDDNTARIWDVASGRELSPSFRGHAESVSSVAFSPDGKWLATGAEDNTAMLWDIETGKATQPPLSGHLDYVRSVAFSPDGKRLATGSDDKTARIWSTESGKMLTTLRGHNQFVRSVAFSPDGKQLATASDDNTAKIWDVESGNVSMTLAGHTDKVFSIAFFPGLTGESGGGARVATGSADKTAKIWDLSGDGEASVLDAHLDGVRSVAFSPDGKTLATGSWDNTARIWDLAQGKEIRRLEGQNDSIWCVAFSPDGKRLAAASDDHTVKIWDATTGKNLMVLQGHDSWVTSVAFSPDGKTLASGSTDKTAKIWDVNTGKVSKTLKGHSAWVNSVAFSPDGKTLASGSSDNTARIWDLGTGQEIMRLEGHDLWINSVVFSPDGKRLATGSHDNTTRMWDLKSGKTVFTLIGHTKWVLSVAFSPDGKRLATGSEDNTFKIWNAENGNLAITIEGHENSVSSVAFSPDGQRLATGSYDFTAKIWEFDAKALVQKIRGARRLTALPLAQLDTWNLETLLDIRPGNEQRLCQTREAEQIMAFANLSVQNAAMDSDNTRAVRLYLAAAGAGDNGTKKRAAHALLLLGRYAEAEGLYLSIANQSCGSGTCKDAILKDLKDLEDQGVTHPDMARIRARLEEPVGGK